MKILSIKNSLTKLESALNSTKAYFVRFGDGDIYAVNKQMIGKRREGIVNIQKLSQELYECLQINDPSFLIAVSGNYPVEPGMVPGLFMPFPEKEFLEKIVTECTAQQTFLNPVLFHYLGTFQPDLFKNLVAKHITNKPKMFIGCRDKDKMERVFGKIDFYVKTPPENSYNSIDEWWPEIESNYQNVSMVIACTGVSSNIVAKRLWNLDAEVQLLDIGSIVDPVCGDFGTRTCWKLKGREVRRSLLWM